MTGKRSKVQLIKTEMKNLFKWKVRWTWWYNLFQDLHFDKKYQNYSAECEAGNCWQNHCFQSNNSGQTALKPIEKPLPAICLSTKYPKETKISQQFPLEQWICSNLNLLTKEQWTNPAWKVTIIMSQNRKKATSLYDIMFSSGFLTGERIDIPLN